MFVLDLNKVHSYVDIITNSSTVIYTWSEGSVDKAKDLLRAMFDLFGEKDMNVDDEFFISVFPEEIDDAFDDWNGNDVVEGYKDWDWKKQSEYLKKMKEYFLKNSPETPDWFKEFVEYALSDTDYNGYTKDNELIIIPKNNKYKPVVDKMIDFLYSTEHGGTRNG